MPLKKRILQPPFFVFTRSLVDFRLWGAVGFWFCLQLSAPLLAGEKAIKWGHIPRADLEMATFPDDTNAAAIILADIGEVSYDKAFSLSRSTQKNFLAGHPH